MFTVLILHSNFFRQHEQFHGSYCNPCNYSIKGGMPWGFYYCLLSINRVNRSLINLDSHNCFVYSAIFGKSIPQRRSPDTCLPRVLIYTSSFRYISLQSITSLRFSWRLENIFYFPYSPGIFYVRLLREFKGSRKYIEFIPCID